MAEKNPQKELVDKHLQEVEEARKELHERVLLIKKAQARQKMEWIEGALSLAMPAWAVKQVLLKNRGWVCRLFGTSIDQFHFDKEYAEGILLMKRGECLALKIFRWNDGEHLEGSRK